MATDYLKCTMYSWNYTVVYSSFKILTYVNWENFISRFQIVILIQMQDPRLRALSSSKPESQHHQPTLLQFSKSKELT